MPYSQDMIAATRGDEIARVDLINDDQYVIGLYENAAAAADANPSSTITLTGTPNAADIIPALPVGFVADPELPATAPVPAHVSPRQIRLWLLQNGLTLASVDTAIGGLSDPALRAQAQVEWEYANRIDRAHPLVIALAEELELTEEEVDEAFREAVHL